MPKPVVLLADGSPMRDRVETELRKRYAADYQLVMAGSGPAALDELARLRDGQDQVCLVLADQQLPGLSGTDLLARVRQLHPAARRALLVSWGDRSSTEAVARATALGDLDAYAAKPGAPPDERFHLVITEQLGEWARLNLTGLEVVRVVGEEWAARSHELRELLGRNSVPFGFYPAGGPEGQRLLAEAGAAGAALPVLIMFDGLVLADPSNTQVADALGVPTRPGAGRYDVTVIGAGPAWPRPSTARRRAWPRSCWSPRPSAARPGPAR